MPIERIFLLAVPTLIRESKPQHLRPQVNTVDSMTAAAQSSRAGRDGGAFFLDQEGMFNVQSHCTIRI